MSEYKDWGLPVTVEYLLSALDVPTDFHGWEDLEIKMQEAGMNIRLTLDTHAYLDAGKFVPVTGKLERLYDLSKDHYVYRWSNK